MQSNESWDLGPVKWHSRAAAGCGAVGRVAEPAQHGSPHCLMDVVSTGCHTAGCVTSLWSGVRHSLPPNCGNKTVSLCKHGFSWREPGSALRLHSGCQESGWREAREGIPGRVLVLAHSWHPWGPINVVEQCPVAGSCWQTHCLMGSCPAAHSGDCLWQRESFV